ncbi:divergent PAP2 family protein [Cohnella endophytica]|uniref:Divergent PAP2 family protein n=1 Tax=Cohnella endophytica TaxID=2419778 RepID=A0A494Y978_9BACL|nr:divergent PAP2 family protein [Cohnella endophytica]RKP58178.1 divergent PAP2 family protein [Cohnella endophytica]
MTSLLSNFALIAAFTSIVLAQTVKVPLHWLVSRSWSPARGFSTGGMPSSHSAGVTSLAAAIGITNGLDSSVFAIAVIFSLITMYDAAGIRRHAGIHATYINRILKSYPDADFQEGKDVNALNERLGHRPIEVAAGAVFGFLVCIMLYLLVYR